MLSLFFIKEKNQRVKPKKNVLKLLCLSLLRITRKN